MAWTVATAQGCIAASTGNAHATTVTASAALTGETPERGTFGSRIAINRPSSCERCAMASVAPASSAGYRPPRMTRAISSSSSA